MGISDILARVKGLVIRPPVDLVEGRYFYATVTPDDKAQRVYTYNASQAELLMRATGYVNICAAMNAMYCASVPIRLYTKAGRGRKVKGLEADWLRRGVKGKAAAYADNAKNITEIEDSPATALLSNPNFTDTGIEFRRLLYYFLDINGNAYVQHDATPNTAPKNLLTLYPQWTVPSIGDDGIFAYRYGRNYTGREEIPASNVIQFKHMPSPQNPWMGVGCLNGVTVEADIYASAVVYEQSFWNNGARPDFALKLPSGSTEDQVKQAHAMLQRRHQGARKGGNPIVTKGDEMTIQPLQWSPREMEYGDGMDRMRRTILNAFGVPLALLEMSDKSLGGGGREFEARQQYLSQTIANRLSSVCERLNENYLPTFGYAPGEVWYAYDNPDTEDQKTVEEQSRLDVAAAIQTINEARVIRGLDPVPDGDVLRFNGVTLDLMGASPFSFGGGTATEDEPKPKEEVAPKSVKRKHKTVYHRLMVVAGKGEIGCDGHVHHKAALSETGKYEGDISEAMRRFFRMITAEARGSELLFDPRAAAEIFTAELTGPLVSAFGAGYDKGGDEVDPSLGAFAIDNRAAREFVAEYIPRLSRTVTATVRDELRAALTAHIEEGGSPDTLANALKEKISGLSDSSAQRIARTESARAYTSGNINAWEDSGVVIGKRWQVSADACEFCKAVGAAANETIGLRTPFFKQGSSMTVGDQTMVFDYSDVDAPPLHPNCECNVEPVLEGEE